MQDPVGRSLPHLRPSPSPHARAIRSVLSSIRSTFGCNGGYTTGCAWVVQQRCCLLTATGFGPPINVENVPVPDIARKDSAGLLK